MPTYSADEALVGPATPRPDPPGIWDIPGQETPPPPVDAIPVVAAEKPAEEDPNLAAREFDPKAKEAFVGLLHLGSLDRDVTLYGHKFLLVTPTNAERIQIGLITQPWRDTLTEEVAWMQAMVAAFLQRVDGAPLPEPISPDPKDTALRGRFNWVGENLRRQVINAIFQECLILDNQVDIALEAMGKA